MLSGGLFTQHFLRDGIRDTAAYRNLDTSAVAALHRRLVDRWERFSAMRRPGEAETENEFIFPTLIDLGWSFLVQPSLDRRRRDVADALLFSDEAAKTRAASFAALDRIRLGVVIVENEARGTHLDRASSAGEAPSSQILRYMSRADVQSDGQLRWGMLINGGTWRLYHDRDSSRAEGYVEADLGSILEPLPLAPADDHLFRVFLLLFRSEAHVPPQPDEPPFLLAALDVARHYRARLTDNLSRTVFGTIFLRLISAFASHDPQADVSSERWRKEARQGAIRLLYRMLFVLYAEDRNLLPMSNPAYREYSLHQLRDDAARMMDNEIGLSAVGRSRWGRLRDVFRAIALGDALLGLPTYNGSLFRDIADDILTRTEFPDSVLVPLVDALSREGESGRGRPLINFRDLSVQHLGSIYERLLEQEVVAGPLGTVALRPSPYARKNSGSFYTPQELVDLILRQAVEPLVGEKIAAFESLLTLRTVDARTPAALRLVDPATAILSLRICDPAMGSGHFLVSLVDLLTDRILVAMASASAALPDGSYASPLATEIEAIRSRILANARNHRWTVDENALDDRHIVRRMVLKRAVFGVDMNPMAVELAKLSLWLHSFTVGAPLSFLDHHLRCGDSLFGEFVDPAITQLEREFGLARPPALDAACNAAAGIALIETRTDLDAAEVAASRDEFAQIEDQAAPLRAFLDLYHASRWLPAETIADRVGRQNLLDGRYGEPAALLAGAPPILPLDRGTRIAFRRGTRTAAPTDVIGQSDFGSLTGEPRPSRAARARSARADQETTAGDAFDAAATFISETRALLDESRFLHWELAFPGVWSDWESGRPSGGFDAVIGNPPWDRIKMQEVEWWAARRDEVARLTRADDRKRAIAGLRRGNDALAVEYDRAAARRKRAAEVAQFLPKQRGDAFEGPYSLYPLFAKGDVNLYALFTERAGQLVSEHGTVGLLVPSGVAADKGAANFFRSISGTGRLGLLLDFENRRNSIGLDPFFPAVDSRFKFSALVHGGIKRRYSEARCAFFQADVQVAEREAFPIAPTDFAAVNPNTGTAPVFRTPADAARVLSVYRRLPVLRSDNAERPYAVAYATQLHMTNDSALFRTAEELERDGAYPVAGGQWERGNSRYRPLMVGRSIHLFDHRFASVMEADAEEVEDAHDEPADDIDVPMIQSRRPTRSRQTHNPFTSRQSSADEHDNPSFQPRPRFWVAEANLIGRWPEGLEWAIGFRDIARPTDIRTVIAAVVPRAAFGNTLPLLLPSGSNFGNYKQDGPLLLANLGSLVLDYVARNKIQSAHLNSYILEQLPVVPPIAFSRRFGASTAEQIVRDDVLALTYTARDLEPFARDQGYTGAPFRWDEEDRFRRRARLDALFFLLFGFDRAAAATIIDSFPILRRTEQARFDGRFRSRDLILRMMAALEAGSPDARPEG